MVDYSKDGIKTTPEIFFLILKKKVGFFTLLHHSQNKSQTSTV
jgi:hypothetical protein